MLNDRPVFALCTTRIHNPEVFESVQAFVDEAQKRGYYVLIFNAALDNNEQTENSDLICFSVFDLVPYQIVDLMVMMSDTLQNPMICDVIAACAKEHRIPLLSYDGVMDGVPSIFSYSNQAFDELLDHVFDVHHCKRVNLLTGIRGHYGSECMVMAYREALHRHGLQFEQERVGYGEYWEEPAAAAAERFLTVDTPDAIVCVNDEMAIAVCNVLRRHGLNVPEDVIVTGSDGILKESFHSPRLTSCVKDIHRLSEVALDTAELILDGADVETNIEIPPLVRLSESCGCAFAEHRDHNEAIRHLYHRIQICTDQESAEYNLLSRVLKRKQMTVVDYLDVMVAHMPEEAYFCLRDCLSADVSANSMQQFAGQTELMQTVSRKQNEKIFRIVQRAELIPDLASVLETYHSLIVTSVYMQGEVFGYYVYYGKNTEEETFRMPKFIHTAGNVIGSGLITSRLQLMNEKLLDANVRDPLTGMLNLHGVEKELEERLKNGQHAGDRFVMVVIGLRRLRQINNTFGRKGGDHALRNLANVILSCIDNDVTAARISGDEFLLAFFGSHLRPDTVRVLLDVLRDRLESFNRISDKNYDLDIAVGMVSSPVDNLLSLDGMLKEAIARKDAQVNGQIGGEARLSVSKEDAETIDRILNENLLEYHFQPIVSARTGQIYAYEALMRTTGGIRMSPLTILNYATQTGRLYEIEWLTYSNVLAYMRANPEYFEGKRVFVNSVPGYFLTDIDFQRLKEQYADLLPQLVVEFTEHAESVGEELQLIRQRCAENHMEIAVDDYGTGYSNGSNLLNYEPAYVKIDRSLITNIQEDPKKQDMVADTIKFVHKYGSMALAEGVETIEEMRALIRFGVHLIQGNYTARPSSPPLLALPREIAAQIVRFSNAAVTQTVTNTYTTDGTPSRSLAELGAEKYTDIFVTQPELELIGGFGQPSNIRIKIKDDLKCRIVLRNVYFKSTHQMPVIQIGRNADVTLEFDGDNRMDMGGILVPESSTLCLTGRGNLSISINETKAFAIGNDADFTCGAINLELAGCLNIISNGDQCIGIGAGIGKGQRISVCGTTLFFKMSGAEGVAIGTLDESCEIDLAGCSAGFELQIAKSTAIGTHCGMPSVRCNTVSISMLGAGKTQACIGSLEGGANISMQDSTIAAEMMGQNILVIGSADTAPNITLRQCTVSLRCEGTRALDIGSYAKDADIMIVDSDLAVTLRSADAIHLGTAEGHCVQRGGVESVKINQ